MLTVYVQTVNGRRRAPDLVKRFNFLTVQKKVLTNRIRYGIIVLKKGDELNE